MRVLTSEIAAQGDLFGKIEKLGNYRLIIAGRHCPSSFPEKRVEGSGMGMEQPEEIALNIGTTWVQPTVVSLIHFHVRRKVGGGKSSRSRRA
jgi:hypothetical protein